MFKKVRLLLWQLNVVKFVFNEASIVLNWLKLNDTVVSAVFCEISIDVNWLE